MCRPAMTRHKPGTELLSGGAEGVRIQLLGGFRVIVGERVIGEAERLRKAAGLSNLLALSPTHPLHREGALGLLWPDLERRFGASRVLA